MKAPIDSLSHTGELTLKGLVYIPGDFPEYKQMVDQEKQAALELLNGKTLEEWRQTLTDILQASRESASPSPSGPCHNVEDDSAMHVNALLLAAIEQGLYPQTAFLLLKQGANVHIRDALGNTPLHYAAVSGRLDIVHLLIAKGADIEARNNLGKTPLECLHEPNSPSHRPIASLLEKQVDAPSPSTCVIS